MKLSYRADHLSIKYFNEVEIADFTVITGVNGSGKTHLLDAIKAGQVIMEDIDKSEVVYYNYNDFSVITNGYDYQNKLDNWKNSTQQYSNKVNIVKRRVLDTIRTNSPLYKQLLYENFISDNFSFDNYYGQERDYLILEEIKADVNSRNNITTYRNRLTSGFFYFLSNYLNDPAADLEIINIKFFQDIYSNYLSELKSRFKEIYPDTYNFLNNTTNANITDTRTFIHEFPHFYLYHIQEEEKNYKLILTENNLNKISATEYNEDIGYLTKEEFLTKFGKSPVELINEVLEEYDCNGYILRTNTLNNLLGVDRNNINMNISIFHKELGYYTDFDRLSSGEKTLIALSILIYKSRKNRIIPRVMLLDEIDSCLHPSMVKRLLDVIQGIFVEKYGLKVILATHSPTTVALSPNKSIYVVNKTGEDKIVKQDKSKAIDILTEGFAALNEEDADLGIAYNLSKNTLPVVFTEGITDKIIIETAWEKLYPTITKPFYIQDCFDASFLANLFRRGNDTQDGIFVKYSDRPLIALFDFDEQGYNSWNSLNSLFKNSIKSDPFEGITIGDTTKNNYAILLPVPSNDISKQVIKDSSSTFENKSSLTIELLFYGVDSLSKYFIKTPVTGGGDIVVFSGNKRDFANDIKNCNKDDFNGFIPLFKQIDSLIKARVS